MSAEKKRFETSYLVMRECFGTFLKPGDYWPAFEYFTSERIGFKIPNGHFEAVFARMTFWLSERLLGDLVKNCDNLSALRDGEDLVESVNDDSPLMKSWKDCYTTEIHKKFLRFPDGNMCAHMYIVSVLVVCDKIRGYFGDDNELEHNFEMEIDNGYARIVLGDVDDFDNMLWMWKRLPKTQMIRKAKETLKATPHLDYLALLYVAEMVGFTILEHASKFLSLTSLVTTFFDSSDDEGEVPAHVEFEQFGKMWDQLYTRSVHRRARELRGPNKPKYVSHHMATASTIICLDLIERYAPNIIMPSVFEMLPSEKKRSSVVRQLGKKILELSSEQENVT